MACVRVSCVATYSKRRALLGTKECEYCMQRDEFSLCHLHAREPAQNGTEANHRCLSLRSACRAKFKFRVRYSQATLPPSIVALTRQTPPTPLYLVAHMREQVPRRASEEM